MAYAANTTVSPEKSRMEIEQTLMRYGATAFGYAREDERAMVTFRANDRYVRFEINLPDRAKHRLDGRGYSRTDAQVDKAVEQAVRQRWRALGLVVKAKLEAVESGITSFEQEFLAHIILPDGSTVGASAIPAIATAYETGDMPSLLPNLKQLEAGR